MSAARAFRLILAVIIAVPVLSPVPAYSWHGSGSVVSLAIDPQTSGTLYAVIPEFGVFKSTDGGATWNTSLRTDSLFHSIDVYGYQADAVLALAIDPQNSATFYASAHYRTTYIDAPFGDWGD